MPQHQNILREQTSPTMAAAVANEFLELSWQEPIYPIVDQMKLQKLLFYAHAWHLAIHNRPLFEETFEAWPWGPVIRDIYIQTRNFGGNSIALRLKAVGPNPFDPSAYALAVPPSLNDSKVKEFVKSIWDTHKEYTGIQLSNSTHAQGEPWAIIKQCYGSLDQKPEIPNTLITDVFKKKLKNANS